MMLFTRQLLLILLPQVFSSAAANDDAAPLIRKRTQQRHSSSGSSAHLRGDSTSDIENFDPFIGVQRELRADDLTRSMSTRHSMSLSMSMTSSPTSVPMGGDMSSTPADVPVVDLMSSTPTFSPTTVQYKPCEDPDQIPLEVNFITDDYAEKDKTGYSLISDPEDGSEPVTYLQRSKGTMSNTKTYNDAICLPKGRYVFTVYDEYNGLCCSPTNAVFSVKIRGTEILWGRRFEAKSISYTILAENEPDLTEIATKWRDGHNSRRQNYHKENGKTFTPVVWSKSLAQAAAVQAEAIVPTCKVTQRADTWGQNTALDARSYKDEAQIVPDTVLRHMFDQKVNAEYPTNLSMTQIAWRGTRYIGCASLIEQMADGKYCHVSVCKYGRPGNCSSNASNWLEKTLEDRSACGETCPDEGCK